MIGTIEIKVTAARPNMPLSPMFAFKGSPSSLRILEVPKKIGDWNITNINVVAHYPDNTTTETAATRTGNVWVATFEGCNISGKVVNGLEITADGIDEVGQNVQGYVLGAGDIFILERDADIEDAVSKITMRYCETIPEHPTIGDFIVLEGVAKFYDGTKWISIDTDLSEYATKDELAAAVSSKAEISSVEAIADDVEDLSNSLSNYYTKSETSSAVEIQVAFDGKQPTGDYALASQIPTNVSQLSNDAGYLTEHQSLSDYYTKSETSSTVELDAKFETKADLASLPTNTSQLSNDSGYITSRQVQPYDTIKGYAKNSLGSLFLFGRNSLIAPNENKFVTMDFNNSDKLTYVERTYPSWFLSQLETTTFDPPLEMIYRYVETYMWRVGARTYRQYIGSNCWVSHSGTKCYYIKADEDGNALPVFYVNSVEHPITFGNFEQSIETMDGETGNISCTRESTFPVTISQKYVAYEDDVSAALSVKADVSAIPTKTSDLSNDSGFITEATFIEDTDGNTINANRNTVVVGDSWVVNNNIVLVGTKLNSYYKSLYDRFSLEYKNNGTWTFKQFAKTQSGWSEVFSGTVEGTEASVELIFNNSQYVLNWRQAQRNDVLVTKAELPTQTSELENNSGFITINDIPAIPTKTSELSNDSGFITSAQVPIPSCIEDANENRINADRSVSYIGDGTSYWQMVSNFSTIPKTINLEGTKTDSSYIPTGDLQDGDVKVHLTYTMDEWQLEIQTWDAGLQEWSASQFFSDTQSSESATELNFGTSYISSCVWTTPRVVINDNLVTESSLSSIIARLEARIAALENQ